MQRAQLWWALLFNELAIAKDMVSSLYDAVRAAKLDADKKEVLKEEFTQNLEEILIWGLVDESVNGNVAELVVSKLNLYRFVQKRSPDDNTSYTNLNSLFHKIMSCQNNTQHLNALAKELHDSAFQPRPDTDYVVCMNDIIADLVGTKSARPLGAGVKDARNNKTKQDAAYRDLLLWLVCWWRACNTAMDGCSGLCYVVDGLR